MVPEHGNHASKNSLTPPPSNKPAVVKPAAPSVPPRASRLALLQCVFLRPRVFVKAIRRRFRAARRKKV